jgi:hypothetical protein
MLKKEIAESMSKTIPQMVTRMFSELNKTHSADSASGTQMNGNALFLACQT